MKEVKADDVVVPERIIFGRAVEDEDGPAPEDMMLIEVSGRYWHDFVDDLDIPQRDRPMIRLTFTAESLVEFVGMVGSAIPEVSDRFLKATMILASEDDGNSTWLMSRFDD